MANINEELIKSVYSEMLKHRPSIAKFSMADDDDDDDVVDYRVLGDMIIKNLPWPIGVELRMLF